MTDIPVPVHAVGRVGMVAMLQRVKPEDVGKLVAVRGPIGYMSSLADQPTAVFAWQVLVLGHAPIDLNGKASREIVVADRCLKPVSQIEPEQVAALAVARAQLDLDEALAEIGRYLEQHPMAPEVFEASVEAAAEQSLFQHVLEVVPLAVALKEIDFRPTSSDEHCVWCGRRREHAEFWPVSKC